MTSYGCKSDAEKIEQVFSVHHFDLIVYDLRGNLEIQSMLSLEQCCNLQHLITVERYCYYLVPMYLKALLVPNLAHQQIGWQACQCLADELPVMYKDIQQFVDREQKMRQKKR